MLLQDCYSWQLRWYKVQGAKEVGSLVGQHGQGELMGELMGGGTRVAVSGVLRRTGSGYHHV